MSLTRRMNSSGLPRLCQAAAWKVKSAILGRLQHSMTQPESMHALQDGCVSVSHDNLDHIRYSYKHGRLHHDDNNGKTNGTAVSAELQTA